MTGALALLAAWRKPLLILLALVALVLAYNWWEGRVEARGYAAAEAEWVAREARIEAAAKDKYTEKLELALGRQKELQATIDKQIADRTTWEKTHETATQKRIAAVLSDNERLRIQVRTAVHQVPGGAQGATAGAAGEPGAAQTADLMPEVAAAILRIGADIAGGVRDYNDLLGRYRAIEAACK